MRFAEREKRICSTQGWICTRDGFAAVREAHRDQPPAECSDVTGSTKAPDHPPVRRGGVQVSARACARVYGWGRCPALPAALAAAGPSSGLLLAALGPAAAPVEGLALVVLRAESVGGEIAGGEPDVGVRIVGIVEVNAEVGDDAFRNEFAAGEVAREGDLFAFGEGAESRPRWPKPARGLDGGAVYRSW